MKSLERKSERARKRWREWSVAHTSFLRIYGWASLIRGREEERETETRTVGQWIFTICTKWSHRRLENLHTRLRIVWEPAVVRCCGGRQMRLKALPASIVSGSQSNRTSFDGWFVINPPHMHGSIDWNKFSSFICTCNSTMHRTQDTYSIVWFKRSQSKLRHINFMRWNSIRHSTAIVSLALIIQPLNAHRLYRLHKRSIECHELVYSTIRFKEIHLKQESPIKCYRIYSTHSHSVDLNPWNWIAQISFSNQSLRTSTELDYKPFPHFKLTCRTTNNKGYRYAQFSKDAEVACKVSETDSIE